MTAQAIFFLTHVVKRDGSIKPFDARKIHSALLRAGQATGEFDSADADELTENVVVRRIQLQADTAPHIEQIQDAVETVLFNAGYSKALRAYIVYREQHKKLRSDRETLADVESSINEYLRQLDWRGSANTADANRDCSLGGLILNVSCKVIANYWLTHIYPPEVGEAHHNADIHIHDLDMLAGCRAGWSLRRFLNEGLNGVPGKVESEPPKHMSSAVGQIVNFLGGVQSEWAGAQAFSSFDTCMAPFIRKDKLSYASVRQCMQELICNLNAPSRWGTQVPSANFSFDWICPENLRGQMPVIGGVEMPFTYGDLQAEMDMINRACIEVMMTGDAKGHMFTCPIPIYNIAPDFDWTSLNATLLFELNARYGMPYFQNFVNSERKPAIPRSMYCRLQFGLHEPLKRGSGSSCAAEQTGSLGVVTLNCARLGYLQRGDEGALMQRVDDLLLLGRNSLEIKRKVIQRHMDNGLFPYTKRYLGTLRNHFSTLGIVGINEMIRNFTNDEHDITTRWGKDFAVRFLDQARARMLEFQEQTGHMYNIETAPAENIAYRFAREDKKRYPDILQAGTPDMPYYTNSSQLPAAFTGDPFEALERQGDLLRLYTGGTVLYL